MLTPLKKEEVQKLKGPQSVLFTGKLSPEAKARMQERAQQPGMLLTDEKGWLARVTAGAHGEGKGKVRKYRGIEFEVGKAVTVTEALAKKLAMLDGFEIKGGGK